MSKKEMIVKIDEWIAKMEKVIGRLPDTVVDEEEEVIPV